MPKKMETLYWFIFIIGHAFVIVAMPKAQYALIHMMRWMHGTKEGRNQMPIYKLTYEIMVPSHIKNPSLSDVKKLIGSRYNLSQRLSKIYGKRPRKKWHIVRNDGPDHDLDYLTNMPLKKTSALQELKTLRKAFPNDVFELVEAVVANA